MTSDDGLKMVNKPDDIEKPLAEKLEPQPTSVLNKFDKNKLVTIAGAALALVVLFGLANYVVPNLLVYVTKASRTGKFSAANSYLFASPLIAKADNEQKVQINVFLLDKEGHGVSGQNVVLNITPKAASSGLPEIFEIRPVSDNNGQAIFELTSLASGNFEITANVGGVMISQMVVVTFR